MKHKLRQFLITLQFTPISFVAIFLFTQLFYKCFNITILSVYLFVAIVGAWFLAKKFQIRRFGHISLLIIIPLVSLAFYGASQGCTRCDAPVAQIKQNTWGVRNQAEISFYDNQSSYEGVCKDEGVYQMKEEIESYQILLEQKCLGPLTKFIKPDFMANSYFNCNDSNEGFAAEAYLPTTSESDEFWCVDSTDFAGLIENSIGDSLSCQ